jgi:hypothetical protein
VIETWVRYDLVALQYRGYSRRFYLDGPGQGKVLIRTEIYTVDPNDLSNLANSIFYEYDPGYKVFPAIMTMGIPWSNAWIQRETDFRYNDPPDESTNPRVSAPRILLGQENVVIDNAQYSDCLKILIGDQILEWHCNGYGLVKRVSNSEMHELTSFTTN